MMTTTAADRPRPLGRSGLSSFPIGLGCMTMSGFYGPADENESVATIHAALDAGVNLLDTGDFYGAGRSELVIGRALKDRREKAILSVKFGAQRGPDGSWHGFDGRPASVKAFLAYSLTRLGVDHVDVYRPSRLDPSVPIEETVGAVADLIQGGYVKSLGLSEVGVETIRRAHAITPVADLQIEYSLVSRGPEEKIFPELSKLGIGVTAYGVLSRGLLSGSAPKAAGDFRAHLPRFTGANAESNRRLVETLQSIAAEKGTSPARLAIAWVLAKNERVVPLVGARNPAQLQESLGALDVDLSPEELARLEAALPPVAGTRYDERQMRMLDSER